MKTIYNSFSLKQTKDKTKPINANVRGFTSMNGNIWKILENIRQRQMQNKTQNSKSKLKTFRPVSFELYAVALPFEFCGLSYKLN